MKTRYEHSCLLAVSLSFIFIVTLPLKTIPAEITTITYEELRKTLMNGVPESAMQILGKPDRDSELFESGTKPKRTRQMIYDWERSRKPVNIVNYNYEEKLYYRFEYIRLYIRDGKIVNIKGVYRISYR